MYKTKTERDLIYEENKDIIRSWVRFQASQYFKRRSNFLLDKMTKRFQELEAEGKEYRLAPILTPEQREWIEAGADEILSLPKGE